MSLRWDIRVDRYQRGDEQIEVTVRKIIGQGYVLRVSCDWYESIEEDSDDVLCTNIIQDNRFFDTQTSLEMFVSRLKKELNFSVDGLIERTYYFGRQNRKE